MINEDDPEIREAINRRLEASQTASKRLIASAPPIDSPSQGNEEDDDDMDLRAHMNQSRKMPPTDYPTPPKNYELPTSSANRQQPLRFEHLPEDITFYLTEVFPFRNKLFMTGILPTGQTFNLVGQTVLRKVFFCLKEDAQLTPEFIQEAKEEILSRLEESGIKKPLIKEVKLKYVFQLEGISRQRRSYIEVRYPFSFDLAGKGPEPDWEGNTFRLVVGTTYTPLEVFIITSSIKGPSWVRIPKSLLSDATGRYVQQGMCASVQDPELVMPIKNPPPIPQLRVMCISLKTAVPAQVKNRKLFNTNNSDMPHLYSLSYSFIAKYDIDKKPAQFNPVTCTYYLRQFAPRGIKDKNTIICEDEKQLLAKFKADMTYLDPDVIACHDATRTIDVLLRRMGAYSEKNDRPKLGRLNYTDSGKQNDHQRLINCLAGRLMADTYIHCKDMIRSVDYDLSVMAAQISPPFQIEAMSEDKANDLISNGETLQVISHTSEEALCTFTLLNHMEILQVTRQLSNICGNLWRRSLENQRAERNQFLIMHNCVTEGFLIPDKFRQIKEQGEGRGAKYAGGLVLEPLKGLYTDFILLLDFNSLYPSIIREYNICFSVLERPRKSIYNFYRPNGKKGPKRGEGAMPENMPIQPPPKEQCTRENWGFLPKLIHDIVEQRKACKREMKDAPADKSIILDIKQKCYKLVANSIYGCLGLQISRFYCEPMAALITRMGREALMRAEEIVNSRKGQVKVIYGDTDSLMIQPLTLDGDDLAKIFQIQKVANDLKKSINKSYNMLEIDVDGIFKPLLLLSKKKYVARKLQNYETLVRRKETMLKFSLECKGIEVVRRDGCGLARKTLSKVIDILMNTPRSQPSDVYDDVYNYIEEVGRSLTQSNYSITDFLFTKQLSKKVSEYEKPESLSHVKVAKDLIMNGEREEALVNHAIQYLVCLPQNNTMDTQAKCCFDLRSFERSQNFQDAGGPLELDLDHYKSEILTPILRLTIHLVDFSNQRLFEGLGVKNEKRPRHRDLVGDNHDEDVDLQVEQLALVNNLKEKDNKINNYLGSFLCACGQPCKLIENMSLVQRCAHCSFNVGVATFNRIISILRAKSLEYYKNVHTCICGKSYQLTPMTKCCSVDTFRKSVIPFQIHQIAYLCREVVEADRDGVGLKLRKRLDKLLEVSSFEKMEHVIQILRM